MTYLDGIDPDWLGGNCPVQGEGIFVDEGVEYNYYFRARGTHWSCDVLAGDLVLWSIEERYSEDTDRFAAGWMSEEEAISFINKAYTKWLEERRK